MSKWIRTGLAIVGMGIAVIFTIVGGIYVFMTTTAAPLHPDPQAVPSVTRAPSAQWTGAVEQARQAVRASLLEQNLPGVSVAVGVGKDLVWAEGFGYADLEKHASVTPETRFRVGDASIALTSAAVGMLLEKNKLNLDVDIQRYVPSF